MIRELVQQGGDVAVAVQRMSEAELRLRALQDHQSAKVTFLVELEGQQTRIETALKSASADERKDLMGQLQDVERAIERTKADLAATGQKIKIVLPEPVKVATTPTVAELPPSERMFGMNRGEFVGVAGFILLLPIALAAARMMWRRGARPSAPSALGSDTRLERLEQAVESVAIEVERIGESQRYTARLLTERQAESPFPHARDLAAPPRKVITPRP